VNPETRRELTQGIVEEAQRLNDLIGNLMFATRLEGGAGGIEVKKEWTTVEEIVGVGLARHRDALSTRPFKTFVSQDLPMIRGDAAMLAQVIHNLVDNALRYTDDGTPIEISAWKTDESVMMKVADQGSGIEPAEFGKVFERLYRGRAARQTQQGGMGLGLTICEGIVKAHGGRIWVEPNQPHGAAFQIALPIELPQPAMPNEADDLQPSRSIVSPGARSTRSAPAQNAAAEANGLPRCEECGGRTSAVSHTPVRPQKEVFDPLVVDQTGPSVKKLILKCQACGHTQHYSESS
jgi:two-component system sensor histidine kinase KdpD